MSVAEMANPVVAAAAAEELMKPETVEEEKGVDEGGEDGDDDELEALRLAALNSIRPKKKAEAPPPPTTGFELKKHPVRNNLVAIVIPSEDDQVPTHSCTSQTSSYLSCTYSFTKWYLHFSRRRSKTNLRGMKSRKPVRRKTRWT